MPYRPEHKEETRARIVECARRLFNRRGFAEVTIDEIMASAGLTRGGFYNHFKTKDALYGEAVASYAGRNPAERWDGVELDFKAPGRSVARQMVEAYLSQQHLDDVEHHCPMIALPSDVARGGPIVRAAYQQLLEVMVGVFESGLDPDDARRHEKALSMAVLCVGGMVVARTVDDPRLRDGLRDAARRLALSVGRYGDQTSPGRD
ncbi:MAG: TetR/AcrR family transcriptional regulator [Alphaproteobacteria bacterium]|nr:TetR/AcrR family transcriptional regulator [Alphaproteobacteria bacterium]